MIGLRPAVASDQNEGVCDPTDDERTAHLRDNVKTLRSYIHRHHRGALNAAPMLPPLTRDCSLSLRRKQSFATSRVDFQRCSPLAPVVELTLTVIERCCRTALTRGASRQSALTHLSRGDPQEPRPKPAVDASLARARCLVSDRSGRYSSRHPRRSSRVGSAPSTQRRRRGSGQRATVLCTSVSYLFQE